MPDDDRLAAVRLCDDQNLVGRTAVVQRRAEAGIDRSFSNARPAQAQDRTSQHALRRCVQCIHPSVLIESQGSLYALFVGGCFRTSRLQASGGQSWKEVRQTEIDAALLCEEPAEIVEDPVRWLSRIHN